MKRSLKKDELRIILNNISEQLQDYRNINRGGCCLFACLIAKQLDKRKIPYDVIIEYPFKSEEEIYEEVNSGTNYLEIHHIFLRVKRKYYDSDGIRSSWHKDIIKLKLNSKDLGMLYAKGDWNPMFRESVSHKDLIKIKNVIKTEFTKYDEKIKNSLRY